MAWMERGLQISLHKYGQFRWKPGAWSFVQANKGDGLKKEPAERLLCLEAKWSGLRPTNVDNDVGKSDHVNEMVYANYASIDDLHKHTTQNP